MVRCQIQGRKKYAAGLGPTIRMMSGFESWTIKSSNFDRLQLSSPLTHRDSQQLYSTILTQQMPPTASSCFTYRWTPTVDQIKFGLFQKGCVTFLRKNAVLLASRKLVNCKISCTVMTRMFQKTIRSRRQSHPSSVEKN